MKDKLQLRRSVTVGELRSLLDRLPAQAPVLVGIRDRHHFNALLGDLPVVRVVIMPHGAGRALVFDVDGVS
jgi:hypothetical protein